MLEPVCPGGPQGAAVGVEGARCVLHARVLSASGMGEFDKHALGNVVVDTLDAEPDLKVGVLGKAWLFNCSFPSVG